MIVFSAIVPHSPLLIESVGKEHRAKLGATLAAFREIEQALYVSQPDCIVITAPHGARYPDAFCVNLAPKYTATLKAFGDFSTTVDAKSDALMIDRIQRKLRVEGVPFTLCSSEELDYGYTVPLLLLTSNIQNRKVVPVSTSELDNETHVEFGRQLKRVLHAEDERVAFIASADLSHAVNGQSPSGATEEGKVFDKTVNDAVLANSSASLLALSADVTQKASQCGLRPILTLLGLLEDMNVKPRILSYEAPFGVGCMTALYAFE